MGKVKLRIPAIDVVPHKGAMSLLRNVLAHDDQSTLCDVQIDKKTLFLDGRGVPSWVGLEYMAQAVAAHAGMTARRMNKAPEIGFWLGTRKAEFFTDVYRLGQTLHVVARHVWGEGHLFSFECFITDASNGRQLAEAQINVFRPGTRP